MRISYFNIIAKKKGNSLYILFGFAILFLQSCNAIFEKDISAETPVVIIPTDNDTVFSNNVHFKWNELEGASFYNLQIVQPSFADIDAFVLDSNINDQEFYKILAPGNYQFQLRGENGGYESMYAGPFSIYVDSVSDLSEQFVSLVSPANEIFINGSDNLVLSWQNLFAAETYDYVLRIGTDFSSASTLDQQFDIATLTYTIPASFFDVEGTYFWGIRGVNLTSSTTYSSRQINVDLTAPNSPDLISPADEVFVSIDDPVVFKWTTGTDPGTVNSTVTSTVEISPSETFIDFEEFTGITSDSLEYTFPSTGDYWWRVKAVDAVGNVSEFYSFEYLITVE